MSADPSSATRPATAFADDDVIAGQAAYTRGVLAAYDLMVHRVIAPWAFGCPTSRLDAHYARHVSANHLDVGIGTGFLLDRCRFPAASPRVAIMDLNPITLSVSARRLSRYRPEVYQRNALAPMEIDAPGFDSIGLNYLLHCLPGTVATKSVALDHLARLANPGARVFGATVLWGGIRRARRATLAMRILNARRIFSNRGDDLDGLAAALAARLQDVQLEVIGCVALFAGCVRRLAG